MLCRLAKSVDWNTLRQQWDSLADTRLEQITSGKDITYNHVLMPEIAKGLKGKKFTNGLDVGCGVGVMANMISNYCDKVIGIDISGKSIAVADNLFSSTDVTFINDSIEGYAISSGFRHDFVLANMFLMDTPNLESSLNAISTSMTDGGYFLSVIPHPAFWPAHYGYADKEWFSYSDEIAVEMEFHISLETNPLMSIHFHRPLEIYIAKLLNAGFTITKFREVSPSPKAMLLYPKPWSVPRYLMIGCTKRSR